MKSRMYKGAVMHTRLSPVKHAFRYPVYGYVFDLDELSELSKSIPFFGYNKIRPVSIHDSDYLGVGEESIREKLFAYLREAGCADGVSRIELVTGARFFNYVFNPVSFYYCYRADGSIRATVAEVNNTFYERHLYILDDTKRGQPCTVRRYTVPKAFHVSPFNDVSGEYDFHFSDLGAKIDVQINVLKEGKEFLRTQLTAKTYPLTSGAILKTIALAPLQAVITIPRIYFQAAVIHFRKKMPIIPKPNPSSEKTIRVAPPLGWERVCLAIIRRQLARLARGTLTVEFPDGVIETFSGQALGERASVRLKNYHLFPKLVRSGSIGLGDSYVNGDWETDDLAGTLRFFLNNWNALADYKLNVLKPMRWVHRFL